MHRFIVNVLSLAIAVAVVWGLTRMTLSTPTAEASNFAHRRGNPTFDQVDRGGRALMLAYARYSIDHGKSPPDLGTLVGATPDLFGIDPVIRPALLPDDVDPTRLRAMEPAALATLLRNSAPFDYLGQDVRNDDPRHAKVAVLASRGFVTNPRSESEQVDVRFVAYADGRTAWVKRVAWPAVWRESQEARRAAGLPPANEP